MGQVYLALDLELDVHVALKTIRPDIANDPQALLRFKREVLIARSISHPNVCRIFDLGRHLSGGSETTFLSMEYLEGEDLARYVRSRGRLEPREAIRLVDQMTSALEAAHEAGIVHRDFKSSNVMVVPSSNGPKAVVTDFGLATAVSAPQHSARRDEVRTTTAVPTFGGRDRSKAEETETESALTLVVGTPAYMSPEQVLGEPSTYASDLYSLGVVFYEILTGQLPFRSDNPREAANLRLTQPPPELGPTVQVSAEVEALVRRLLERHPTARPKTARDVRRLLLGKPSAAVKRAPAIPAERDEFIGRETELSELRSQLESGSTRLLSIIGPGGVGKTRLSRRYGWQSVEQWPGGVWFCDLTEARSLDGIALSAAAALGVELGRDDPITLLGRVLANRGQALVILDNFEQVSSYADASVGRWLELAPDVRFMVTSRERLQVAGELVVMLEPLESASDGVRLFECRAGQHRPGFQVDRANEEVVTDIVDALDGLPLAIEMAASRLQALSLNQLRERLHDRWGILSSRRSGKHATMRKTLDWSWDLLHPWERQAVIQASVFQGGFDLEAAERVVRIDAQESGGSPPQTIDVIQSLVDKSWIRSYMERDTPRFSMLPSIQDYVLMQSKEGSSAERKAAERRHWTHYATFGSPESLQILGRREGVETRRTLRIEIDNLVSACRRAGQGGDGEACHALHEICADLLSAFGPVQAAARLGREILEEAWVSPARQADVHLAIGRALGTTGELEEAKTHSARALELARSDGNVRLEGPALGHLATTIERLGDADQARSMHEEALSIYQKIGNRQLEAIALSNLGTHHIRRGDGRQGATLIEQALLIHREVGSFRGEAIDLVNLAWAVHELGELDLAETHYQRALSMLEELENRKTAATVHNNMGNLHKTKGQYGDARSSYSKARDLGAETGDRVGYGLAVLNLAIIDQEERKTQAAHDGLLEALNVFREIGHVRFEGIVTRVLATHHREQGDYDSAQECYAKALDALRQVGDRVSEGHVLGALGQLHYRKGDIPAARQFAEEALALHRSCEDRAEEGVRLGDLADYDRDEGNHEEARRKYDQAEEILRELEYTHQLGVLLCERALCERMAGSVAVAEEYLEAAEKIAGTLVTGLRKGLTERIAEVRGHRA